MVDLPCPGRRAGRRAHGLRRCTPAGTAIKNVKCWNSGNVRSNQFVLNSSFLAKRRNVDLLWPQTAPAQTQSVFPCAVASRGGRGRGGRGRFGRAEVGGAEVGGAEVGAVNTNAPTEVSWWGFSDSIIYVQFNLLMQAIEDICNSEWSRVSKGTSNKRFLWEWDL